MNFNIRKMAKWLIPAIIILSASAGYFIYRSDWLSTGQVVTTTQAEEIKGKIITLKQLQEDYFLDYHSMFSSTVRKALEFPENITVNYTLRYLRLEMEKSLEGKQLMYCIFDNKDQKLIGSTEIREKNPNDPGQFTFWINENYWGGGRAEEATKLIAHEYFRLNPDRNSFTAHVRLWNKRSYYALKKSGFKEIGYFYENGEPTRHIMEYYRD